MSSTLVTSYLLAVAGLAVMFASVARTFSRRIAYAPAREILLKLLVANPKRAEKLVHAAPGTFFDALGAALRAGASATSRDPVTVAATTHPAYEQTAATISKRTKVLTERGLFGAVFAVGGAAFAYANGELPGGMITCGVLGLLGGLWLVTQRGGVERSLRQARNDCLPEIDKVFVEGRYHVE